MLKYMYSQKSILNNFVKYQLQGFLIYINNSGVKHFVYVSCNHVLVRLIENKNKFQKTWNVEFKGLVKMNFPLYC